ncbi:hypothetical protein H696_01432 [Fonticula alba]|uniref:AAA+ ATPase domain-containing protein n=1 Tax=Fonticula alba TaxID=691883 RepID=A0A058ZC91_FONAL|nr:hypothetical protein H696_01432 [Fonticula alba]KCV72025.1 hypothetical protein H696_01432 [Fonticula alba]|eukprot:XP_009493603.1 hypothetical protein H696_01432 [Fonticula alba]
MEVDSPSPPRQDSHLPWIEKYRPSGLEEVVAQEHIVSTLKRFINQKQLPHLLFYGPPGTGKTSTALACCRALYGPTFGSMVLELNASDERGIATVRDRIVSFASTSSVSFRSATADRVGFKMVILDEADAMTNIAQAALRRIIEKYTKHVRFVLICNYAARLIPALQSRCTRMRFGPLGLEKVSDRVKEIAALENVRMTPCGLQALLRLTHGDMRRALNILQAAHASVSDEADPSTSGGTDTGAVNATAIYQTTGHPHPDDVELAFKWLLNEDYVGTISRLEDLTRNKGIALQDLVREIHPLVPLLDIPKEARIFLLDQLSELEYSLAQGCSEHLQIGFLVGFFQECRLVISRFVAPAASS